jgi:microcystin-dependent protein
MGTPFIGQLLLTSWGFAPRGIYAQCNGQLMSIRSNQPLFALLGVAYGGDGINTFALPNLQGRTAIGMTSPSQRGQIGGAESHTLTSSEVPGSHTHQLLGSSAGPGSANPAGNAFATTTGSATLYGAAGSPAILSGGSISSVGGQGHENRQPFLVMNWSIALQGIYPSRG